MKKAIFIYALKVLSPTAIAAFIWWCSAEPFSRGPALAGVALLALSVSILVAGANYESDIGKEQRTLNQRLHNAEFELSGLYRTNKKLGESLASQVENVEELNRELRLRTRELGDARTTIHAQGLALNAAKETIKELEQKS